MSDERIDSLLAQLSVEEKVTMLAGSSFWHAGGVPRLGIPELKVSDGPVGARGAGFTGGITAASFPCGTALGATWNPELVERVGAALGDEARSKGARVLLGPTVNIHRSPLGGRNFECYSEDPHLTSRIAVAHIRGVQSRKVAATVKHLVANDSEFERHTISSEVGERALREIYLPPFEAAVREAGCRWVMASYNRLNGTYTSEDPWLLGRLLREEWGFEGVVVSDWFGTQSTEAAVEAGLDLEMPGPPRHRGEKLLEAVRAGRVDEKVLDTRVRPLLDTLAWTGRLDEAEETPERAIDLPEHRALAREAAAESIVLLRNDGGLLPLDAGALESLAVIGPAAEVLALQGGGSARVNPHYEVSPLEGIRARLPESVTLRHEPGCTHHKSIPPMTHHHVLRPDGEPGFQVDFHAGFDLAGDPVETLQMRRLDFTWLGQFTQAFDPECYSVRATATLVAPTDGTATLSLTSAGHSRLLVDGEVLVDDWNSSERGESFFGAGSREVVAGLELQAGRRFELELQYSREGAKLLGGVRLGCLLPLADDAMERAEACAAECDAAVVVVGLTADWETEGRDRADMRMAGRQAELVERVARANPRTVVVLNCGAPVQSDGLDAAPAALQLWYPGQEGGNALADVLFGDADPGGRMPQTWPRRLADNPAYLNYPGERGSVLYGEGVFVGYRYYDAVGIEPRFPFGHGLSYGEFEYGALELDRDTLAPGQRLVASIEVRNVGTRPGREVVQLYVADPESSLRRPDRELRGFEKLSLAPGESRSVRFELGERELAAWCPDRADWWAEPGVFELAVGRSVADLRARAAFVLEASPGT